MIFHLAGVVFYETYLEECCAKSNKNQVKENQHDMEGQEKGSHPPLKFLFVFLTHLFYMIYQLENNVVDKEKLSPVESFYLTSVDFLF